MLSNAKPNVKLNCDKMWKNRINKKIDFHNEMSMLTTNKSVCVGEEYKVGHSSITENKLHKPFSIRR